MTQPNKDLGDRKIAKLDPPGNPRVGPGIRQKLLLPLKEESAPLWGARVVMGRLHALYAQ